MQRQIRQLLTANGALLCRALKVERLAERRCARLMQESDALHRSVLLRRAES